MCGQVRAYVPGQKRKWHSGGRQFDPVRLHQSFQQFAPLASVVMTVASLIRVYCQKRFVARIRTYPGTRVESRHCEFRSSQVRAPCSASSSQVLRMSAFTPNSSCRTTTAGTRRGLRSCDIGRTRPLAFYRDVIFHCVLLRRPLSSRPPPMSSGSAEAHSERARFSRAGTRGANKGALSAAAVAP